MKAKTLIIKLRQLQEEIKASLPVSAGLSNDFTSFWKLTKGKFTRLILEEQQKYLQSLINNATYHSMNPDVDVPI